jgi:hypothetical protein
MKKLLFILLFALFAGCASYHDGNRKGIFLKNDRQGIAIYADIQRGEKDNLDKACAQNQVIPAKAGIQKL